MKEALLLGTLFGLGAILVLISQPRGRPRVALRARLEALRPERSDVPPVEKPAVFRAAIFERALRPLLQETGERVGRLASLLGFDLAETSARLRSAGDSGGLGLFLGQKVAGGLVGFALLPAAVSFSALYRTPPWFWIAAGMAGFFLPDAILRARAEARRRELREGLARFADLLSLAVSSGLGLEAALDEMATASEGVFFDELRRFLWEARLGREPAPAAIGRLATELGLSDAEPLAGALAAAQSQGMAISKVLRFQARAIRERRRLELIEAGERAQVKMVLPVGLLILPAFFLVVLYPAAVQLLQLSVK